MSILFTTHSVIVDGVTYFFLCKPVTYQSLFSETGIQEVSDSGVKARCSVGELLGANKLVRMALYYEVGLKRCAAKILCRPDLASAFMYSAQGTPYRGGIIRSATRPNRVRFYR